MAAQRASLFDLSVVQAAAALRRGEITAESYAQALSARAEATAHLNIFMTRNPSLAEQARGVDLARARGEPLGALAGVPLLIKDNIDSADWPTTAGTPALRDWRPAADAPVLRRLLDAGALVMGKANLQELALGITSNNRAFGPVHNPHAPELIAGGSSGGTAAGIAGGVAPGGLGTDTAGSIRIPASLCGVAGLRPSQGRYPQAGIVPLSHSRDTAGPMARTVADLALLDEVIAGEPAAPPGALRAVRLGLPIQHFWDDLDPQTASVATTALERIRHAGAELVEIDVGAIVALAARIGRALTLYECVRDLDAYLAAAGAPVSAAEVVAGIASPDVAAAYSMAGSVSRETYLEARDTLRPELRRLYQDLFAASGVAALAFPATPLPARPIGEDETVELNGRRADTRSTYLRNTEPAALAGLPALCLPMGLTTQGLPVGLELDGPAGADGRLLGLGAAIEAVLA